MSIQGNGWGAGDMVVSSNGVVIGTINGIKSIGETYELSDREAKEIYELGNRTCSISMTIKPNKKLSPTLRQYFKNVCIGDQLYV